MGVSPKTETAPAEGFERAFDLVGGHGWFQWRLLLIVAFQLVILTWHHIGYTFLGTVPAHWCSIPELQSTGWTLDQIKQISIPALSTDPSSEDSEPSSKKYQNCEYYDLDYTILAQSSSFQEAYSKVNWDNVTTKACGSWQFDNSTFKSTVATEFSLVCDKRYLAATIQGSYMMGGLIGTLTFGSLSDKVLGRRKAVLISLVLVVSGGIIASFATSYWAFLTLRLVISIGVSGSMQNCFILVTEHADKEYRALFGLVEQLAFGVGYMLLPALAYYLRHWNELQLSFGLISTGLITYYWVLPESPRWLATHGQIDRSVNALYKIAKANKMPKPRREDLEMIVRECAEEEDGRKRVVLVVDGENRGSVSNGNKHVMNMEVEVPEKKESRVTHVISLIKNGLKGIAYNFSCLMRAGEIRKRSFVFWFLFMTVAMVYYGIVFSGNLTSDPYMVVFLGGLMEVPAYTVIVPFVSKLGRRPTTSGNFILTGICMIGLSRTPASYETIRIVLAMSAKLFISAGFAIIYLLGAELYPTELRTTGLAVGVFMGRVGAISAPYIVDLLQNIVTDLPAIIFGSFAAVAGIAALLLPETKTLEMSDKVREIEKRVEVEKAKERDRKLSWVVGDDGDLE